MFKSLFRVVAAAMVCTCAVGSGQQGALKRSECYTEARRVLGTAALVIRDGDFLHSGHPQCFAVLPYRPLRPDTSNRVRKGFIREWDGATWHDMLRFEANIQNPRGYVGVDFIDVKTNFGFSLKTAENRSDGTPGFTLYLTYLNPQFEPEGVPVQVSWNPSVGRFQEYAIEFGSPGFKPGIPNPPVGEVLKGAPRHPAPQPPK